MADLIKRKKACPKCDGWYNYKSSRNCYNCKKSKRIQDYTKQLESIGKERDTARKKAKANGDLTYFSKTACKDCGSYERYVSSAGCMKCQKSESIEKNQKIKQQRQLSSNISYPNLRLFFNMHIDAVMFDEEDSELSANLNDSEFNQLLAQYLNVVEILSYQNKNRKGEYTNTNYISFVSAKEKYARSPQNHRLNIDLLYAECVLFEDIKKSKYNEELPEFQIFKPNIHKLSDVYNLSKHDKK